MIDLTGRVTNSGHKPGSLPTESTLLPVLQKLCEIPAVSGREDALAGFILNEISPFAECGRDALGNIIALKKGKERPQKRVMLDAHMDEVGFMITGVSEDGFLLFDTVGGIDAAAVFGSRVKICAPQSVLGVIASTPVHLLDAEERKKPIGMSNLVIDIGAGSREEALRAVNIGDAAVFEGEFTPLGEGKIRSRALDDRVGCAVLIDLCKRDWPVDLWFTFTVQEEVGLRGAETAAFAVKPDIALILEATFAVDLPGISPERQVCRLGEGTAVSFMDGSTIYDKNLYDFVFQIARDHNLPVQPKSIAAGGNNSGAVHLAGEGVQTAALSVPCRYIHSQNSLICVRDLEITAQLALVTAERLAGMK